MPIIETKKLKIAFGDNVVLNKADLQINEGDLVLFLGTNGSGKTTMVRAILGLIETQGGKIEFDGSPWNIQFVSNEIGYLPQYSQIDRNFPISVRELIQLSCNKTLCNDPKNHLEYLDSEQLIDRPISDLSGGEFQRVMLARALENSPRVIVYDEPTNNLDDATSQKLLEVIKELQKSGKTQIIITHDDEIIHAFKKKKIYVFKNKTLTLSKLSHHE